MNSDDMHGTWGKLYWYLKLIYKCIKNKMEGQVHASRNGSTRNKWSTVTCQWWNLHGYMDGNGHILLTQSCICLKISIKYLGRHWKKHRG